MSQCHLDGTDPTYFHRIQKRPQFVIANTVHVAKRSSIYRRSLLQLLFFFFHSTQCWGLCLPYCRAYEQSLGFRVNRAYCIHIYFPNTYI